MIKDCERQGELRLIEMIKDCERQGELRLILT
jgi:hypothetical protein